MNNKVVKILNAADYRSFKGWVTDVGNINPVFIAGFQHPLESKPIDMYVKLYSLSNNDRSVFNEILGYLMAYALRIPQPKYACIALLPTDMLKRDLGGASLNSSFEQEVFQREVFPAFCTSKIDRSQTAFQYHGNIKLVIDELAKWSHLGAALAIDNTIAHVDRHMNNLLRTGSKKYHLIDNGILVSPTGWKRSDLISNSNFDNRLLSMSDLMPSKQRADVRSSAIAACDTHANALIDIEEEIKFWIDALYKNVQNDYNEFMNFIGNRVADAPGLLLSRLQMVI